VRRWDGGKGGRSKVKGQRKKESAERLWNSEGGMRKAEKKKVSGWEGEKVGR
jgi:hypothetical protein